MAMWPATVDAIALLGPTASGKSALAMKLAREVALEIVTVDSAQVYRGLDVGSAKPTLAERAAVAHHLIDIRDPTEPYSAADFVVDAGQAIAANRVRAAGCRSWSAARCFMRRRCAMDCPICRPRNRRCGRGSKPRRKRAAGRRCTRDSHSIDPATAERLRPTDSATDPAGARSARGGRPADVELFGGVTLRRLHWLYTVALLPNDRAELHRRIEQRFDAMLAAGLLGEVDAAAAAR
jgi:tRNA dimethylallyltransferase